MSSTVTVRPAKGVRGIGLFVVIAGIVMILAGAATWATVAVQLSAEHITVSDDAAFLAGRPVNGPLTAYAQAEVINKHALEMSDGLTYAELPQDDDRRDAVMTASFLRASLFTSVVAFGVAALVIGLGVVLIFLGLALRKLAGGPSVVVETPSGLTSAGNLSSVDEHRSPAHVAPPAEPPGPTPPPGFATTAPPAAGVTAPMEPTSPGNPPTRVSSIRAASVPPVAPPVGPGTSPEAAEEQAEADDRPAVPPVERPRDPEDPEAGEHWAPPGL